MLFCLIGWMVIYQWSVRLRNIYSFARIWIDDLQQFQKSNTRMLGRIITQSRDYLHFTCHIYISYIPFFALPPFLLLWHELLSPIFDECVNECNKVIATYFIYSL